MEARAEPQESLPCGQGGRSSWGQKVQGTAECPPSPSQPVGWYLQWGGWCGPGISPSLGQLLLGLPQLAFRDVNRAVCWSGEAGECATFISQEPDMVFGGFLCARKAVSLFTLLKQWPPDVS